MSSLDRLTVLVVDDSPGSISFLTQALEQEGADVLVARSGEAALAITSRIVPDIVLLDALMPGKDGFQTCLEMKQSENLADVPVIFMTGLEETEHIVRAFSVGGVDYVTKPFAIAEVVARIKVHGRNAGMSRLVRRALETTGRHLVAVDAEGNVLWASPLARAMLAPDAPISPAPKAMQIGVAVAHTGRHDLTLTLLGPCGPDDFLLEIAEPVAGKDPIEELRAGFGLTLREAEVLLWLARGKSSRDMAEILSLSPRTVDKHLETIFRKLGVENRTSAVALAIARL